MMTEMFFVFRTVREKLVDVFVLTVIYLWQLFFIFYLSFNTLVSYSTQHIFYEIEQFDFRN